MPRRALGLPWPPPSRGRPTSGRLGFPSRYRTAPEPESPPSETSRRRNLHPGGSAPRNPPKAQRLRPPGSERAVLQADGDASRCQVFLRLRDGILAEVEDRGGEDGAGTAFGQALVEMLQRAHATAGDD